MKVHVSTVDNKDYFVIIIKSENIITLTRVQAAYFLSLFRIASSCSDTKHTVEAKIHNVMRNYSVDLVAAAGKLSTVGPLVADPLYVSRSVYRGDE